MVAPRAVIALAGPTGAGKTDLGIALARRFDAEIINADSRQVYRGLDIGSAKPTAEQFAAVPHHLFDVVDPDEQFDCARYRELLAVAAIEDIHRRGKRALLVGGTGLYIKVVRGGLFAGPPRDPALRERYTARDEAEPGWLYRQVATVDAPAATRVHPNDRIRLIRALEVFETTGRPITAWQQEHQFRERTLEVRVMGITVPRPELYERIDRRCQEMIAQGLVDEVRQLLARGHRPELAAMQSVGYRELAAHLLGNATLEKAIEDMARATRRLAKRQLTWFRGDAELIWSAAEVDALVATCSAWWL